MTEQWQRAINVLRAFNHRVGAIIQFGVALSLLKDEVIVGGGITCSDFMEKTLPAIKAIADECANHITGGTTRGNEARKAFLAKLEVQEPQILEAEQLAIKTLNALIVGFIATSMEDVDNFTDKFLTALANAT